MFKELIYFAPSVSFYFLVLVLSVFAAIFTILLIIRAIIRFVAVRSVTKSAAIKRLIEKSGNSTSLLQMIDTRGKKIEHKRVIRYFGNTLFRMPDSAFDELLNAKIQEYGAGMRERALEAHGIDADEVKELPPIHVGNYYVDSLYLRMFADHSFRYSEFQMTYLMFSDKQVYIYSNIFDLTSSSVSETTKEYFYSDITSLDITHKGAEVPNPRQWNNLIYGVILFILGLLLIASMRSILESNVSFGLFCMILSPLAIIFGDVFIFLIGYSRGVANSLVMTLTAAGDNANFVCAMQPKDINAIQGMKAKIREKKQ